MRYWALCRQVWSRTQVTVVFALAELLGNSMLVYMPHDGSILAVMPVIAIFSVVSVACTPASMHRPHALIIDADDDEDDEVPSPTGSVLLDCFVAFASEDYQSMLLVTIAGALCSSIPAPMPGVWLFFVEDYTRLGADSSAFKASVTAAFYFGLVFLVVPAGRLLDILRQPMEAFCACVWLAAAMIAATLLSKDYSPYWSVSGVFGMNFVYVAQSFLLTPCFMQCVTNLHTLGRDVNFMFAIIAVVQTALPLGISPIYEWFDSTAISGRDRPIYAFEAYICIIGGFACLAISSGLVLLVARGMLQIMITNRIERVVDRLALDDAAVYSGCLAPLRPLVIRRQVKAQLNDLLL